MKDMIFEALVTEAQFRVAEHTITGIDTDEAIREVSVEMELVKEEVDALRERVKKAPQRVKEDDDSNMEDLVSDINDSDEDLNTAEYPTAGNSIHFSNADEMETAVGVLMYKGIPWVTKGPDHLVFQDSSDVTNAHEALKRRWDFVNAEDRTVAVLEFDNLDDFQKVLDFISSKNMTVVHGSNENLVSDVDQDLSEAEEAHKKARKDAKEAGLPAPELPAPNMSYKALHREKLTDVKSLDPTLDDGSRCLRVVKRWK